MKPINLILTLCIPFALLGCNVDGGNGDGNDTDNVDNSEIDNSEIEDAEIEDAEIEEIENDNVDTPSTSASLAQQAYLKANNAEARAEFGYSVGLDSDTLVVGAPVEGDRNDGAVYVFIRSDGIWSQQAYLKASNGKAHERFGQSVNLDGDTLVVGAPRHHGGATGNLSASGAAYVFTRNGEEWSEQAYLVASNAGSGDLFGTSVTLDGDTLVVGAPSENGDANSTGASPNRNADYAGAAYVFTRNGTVWSQEAYLKASNAGDRDSFGYSVAIAGDSVVVGAPNEDGDANSTTGSPNDNARSAGAAYIFTRSGGSWSQQAYLKASNVSNFEEFGSSVAIDGETLVVGAHQHRGFASLASSGAAYVFTLSDGIWSQQAYLKASDTQSSIRFGYSVGLDDDTLVVGAQSGEAAYVFTRSAEEWSQSAHLKARNAGHFHRFGKSVALDGETFVVGAHLESGDANSTATSPNSGAWQSGSVYVFR